MKCKWGSPKKALQCRNEKRLHMPVYMQILLVHMCVNIWQLLGTGAVSLFLYFLFHFFGCLEAAVCSIC